MITPVYKKSHLVFIVTVLLLSLTCAVTNAGAQTRVDAKQQTETGTITGRVMGALVPLHGARVVLMKRDEVIDAATADENGHYTFRYVNLGYYTVQSSMDGYKTYITTKVPVTEEEHTTSLNIYLPRISNSHVTATPVTEQYQYPKKHVADLRKEDSEIEHRKPLE